MNNYLTNKEDIDFLVKKNKQTTLSKVFKKLSFSNLKWESKKAIESTKQFKYGIQEKINVFRLRFQKKLEISKKDKKKILKLTDEKKLVAVKKLLKVIEKKNIEITKAANKNQIYKIFKLRRENAINLMLLDYYHRTSKLNDEVNLFLTNYKLTQNKTVEKFEWAEVVETESIKDAFKQRIEKFEKTGE